eukprot:GHRR01006814.1.p3 GENE.GHRR01006814.1~~GHRR01006814.1.p3  ORF type:complete len:109 (-),score=24.56 GHRR01006814.1:557-883(-)
MPSLYCLLHSSHSKDPRSQTHCFRQSICAYCTVPVQLQGSTRSLAFSAERQMRHSAAWWPLLSAASTAMSWSRGCLRVAEAAAASPASTATITCSDTGPNVCNGSTPA